MPANTRQIRRRIVSVRNTRKVTKAMELVSAAKMRKAVERVNLSRPYAKLAWQALQRISNTTSSSLHPLLAHRPVKSIGVIHVSSNRGLCGAFNSQLAAQAFKFLEVEQGQGASVSFVTLGSKGKEALARAGAAITADFAKADITTAITALLPIAKLAITDYMAGSYDRVVLAYTDYVSSLKQIPRLKTILPIDLEADPMLGLASQQPTASSNRLNAESRKLTAGEGEYLFEPTPQQVLTELLPRLIEVQLYQAVLESEASEHSARMFAMRNASDAASDMIDELTLAFNQARQGSITQEVLEINSGKVALETK